MAMLLAVLSLASGMFGTVSRGPTMPVCQVGEPCSQPAAGVTLVFSRGGHDVARVKSGPAGGYRVELPGGLYSVRTVTQGVPGRGLSPLRVRVPLARMAHVNFTIDTGIR